MRASKLIKVRVTVNGTLHICLSAGKCVLIVGVTGTDVETVSNYQGSDTSKQLYVLTTRRAVVDVYC